MNKRGEIVFVAVLIVFSVAALWESYGISGFSKLSSPGVFPMLASATMLVSALFILLGDCEQRHLDNRPTESLSEGSSALLPMQVIVSTILVLLYVIAMPTLGFLLSSGLFLFAAIGYLWNRPLWMALVVSVVSLIAIHVVFRQLFQVILPQGSLINHFL